MDKDHPEYRRTIDAVDEIDPDDVDDHLAAIPRSVD
jgi:hypothetical protein